MNQTAQIRYSSPFKSNQPALAKKVPLSGPYPEVIRTLSGGYPDLAV
jgi:hypothetical protein